MRKNETVQRGWHTELWIAAALAVATFGAYVPFAARDLMFGDGGELTLAAVTNGVAHPPGYPLWIVLAHLFTLLPIGALPFRVSASAAFFHAVAIGFVYLTAHRLTQRRVAAFAAAGILLVSPLFVRWSLQPEVFSLNDAIAAAIVFCSIVWLEDSNRSKLILPIAALFGLGIANQQTIVLLVPLALWPVWRARASLVRQWRTLLGPAAALLVAGFFIPYAHTFLASRGDLAWKFGEVTTVPGFVDLVDRHAYGTASLVVDSLRGGNASERMRLMLELMGLAAFVSLAGGLALVVTRRWQTALVPLLVWFGTVLSFCVVANVNVSIDPARVLFERFALMPLVALAPFAACTFDVLDRISPRLIPIPPASSFALAIAVIAGPHVLAAASLADAHDARTLARDEFVALPAGAVAFAKGDTLSTTLPYFQIVEHWRSDCVVVYVDLLAGPWYRQQLERSINVPTHGRLEIADVISANPHRSFYGIGDPDVQGALNLNGPLYAYTSGLASKIVSRPIDVPLPRWYAREAALQNARGYAQLTARDARYNGFTANARGYYANGFFNAGVDAQRLHDSRAAALWFARAHVERDTILVAQRMKR